MKVTTFLFGALFAANAATAAPVEDLGKRRLANNPVTDQQLADAKANYKGIHWDTAADSCTTSQFAILMESTRVALDMMSYDYRSTYSPGFTRFFGDRKIWDYSHNLELRHVIQNLRQVADFARLGRGDKQHKKISYYCGDVQHYTNCKRKSASGVTVPAYTINATGYVGKIDDCPTCNAIGFCDVFWSTRVRYANAVIKDKPSLNDLASVNTYEHVLIHEWMHNDDVIGLSSHIVDVKDYLYDSTKDVKQAVYGALNCARYSAKSKGWQVVNMKTAENADSYAWMITNNYFNKQLGWGDNGNAQLPFQKRSLISTRDNGPPAPLYPIDEAPGDDTNIVNAEDLPAFPTDAIPSCQSETTCQYIGDETDNPPAPATSPPAAPPTDGPLTCNGLASEKYVAAATLDDKIITFCSGMQTQMTQDAGSGSYSRTFNTGTRDEVEIAVDWPPGQTLNMIPCAATMNEISAGCDNPAAGNPRNWKGGGSKQVGVGLFHINPKVARSAHPTKFCPDSKPTKGDLTSWQQSNVCGDVCPDGISQEGGSDPKVARFGICSLSEAVKNCGKAFANQDELPYCWIMAV